MEIATFLYGDKKKIARKDGEKRECRRENLWNRVFLNFSLVRDGLNG